MADPRVQQARERAEHALALTGIQWLDAPHERIAGDVLYLADRVAALETALRWIVEMDDPEDVLGLERRRTITLTQIIDHCRDALAGAAAEPETRE